MPTDPPVAAAHIRLDARGVAWIDDTNTKVVEVALDHLAHGWSPEEIHFQHTHLSLGQIHAALAYYHDNLDITIGQCVADLEMLSQCGTSEDFVNRQLRHGVVLGKELLHRPLEFPGQHPLQMRRLWLGQLRETQLPAGLGFGTLHGQQGDRRDRRKGHRPGPELLEFGLQARSREEVGPDLRFALLDRCREA